MPATDPNPDADLLARWRAPATRRQAERELFERFRAPLERMLRRLLGRDADDALQESFVDVLRGLPAFEGRATLATWVYRIALRRAWKCLADRRRSGRADEPSVDRLPSREPSASARLQSTELAQRFERALDRLDLHQRTVLSLAAIEGLGPPEIADVLGIPVGTVHSRLHRARARMSEYLGLD